MDSEIWLCNKIVTQVKIVIAFIGVEISETAAKHTHDQSMLSGMLPRSTHIYSRLTAFEWAPKSIHT